MKKSRGIRKKVVGAVTLLIMVSFTLLGVSLSALIYKNEKDELVTLQREVAGYAVNEMRWDIHELEALLGLAGENYYWQMRKGITTAGFLSQILMAEHMKHHHIVEELSFIDESGRERERAGRTVVYGAAGLRDLSGSDEFAAPKEVGQIYYGPVTFEAGTFAPYMTISLPVMDMKREAVKAVLMAKIRLNKVWENAVERTIGENGIVFITDDKGKVLAHPDPSVIFRNTYYTPQSQEGKQRGLNSADVTLVSKKVEIGNRTFIVYTAVPFGEVVSLSMETLFAVGIFFLFFLVFSISLCLVAVNHFIRPIEALADNARKITAGQLVGLVAVSDGDEIGDMYSAFNVMTSRLLETIDSLEARNALLNNILNSLTHPFYVIDAKDYTIQLANPAANFGELSEPRTCYALTHQRHEPCAEADHPCIIALIKDKAEPAVVEHVHYDQRGNPLIVEIHGYPVFDKDHNVVQVIEYIFDITARKKMEEDLHISEQKNRTITTTAKDAIIMMDENGLTSFWNPAAESIFGYTEGEVMNRELHAFIMPERNHDYFIKAMKRFRETGEGNAVGRTVELVGRRKDGSEMPVELSLSAIRVKGRWHSVGIVRDITQRKLTEKKILASLEEKEVLLQEVHHRVKNNMQVISSLLDLQLDCLGEKPPREIFSEIKNRIRTMSLVHEKLYLSRDLSRVDFQDYLTTLTDNLYKSYNVSLSKVALDLDVGGILLGIDTAIPCGLIVNELITNSLKYAFPGERKGEIRVALRQAGAGERGESQYELTVRDDGVGIPEDVQLRGVKTLGLYLVTTLVEHQLQGSIHLHRTAGTRFDIVFKELKYKRRI